MNWVHFHYFERKLHEDGDRIKLGPSQLRLEAIHQWKHMFLTFDS